MTINPVSLHFVKEHPRDAARVLEQFSVEQLSEYLQLLPVPITAELLKFIISSIAVDCLKLMPIEKSVPVISQMGVERATVLLRRMKTGMRVQFIRAMSPVLANMARLVLRYPEGTVGRVMNPHVFTVNVGMNVDEVMNAISKTEELQHNVIFIVNDQQQLVGIIDIRQLLMVKTNMSIKKLMHEPPETIPARSSIKQVSHHPDWETGDNFPVTDHMGNFIGVLQRSDLYKHTGGKQSVSSDEELTGTALAIAEIFWDTCADILMPDYSRSSKGQSNE